jgi:hypothetical protein
VPAAVTDAHKNRSLPGSVERGPAKVGAVHFGMVLIWIKTISLATGFHLLIRVSGVSIWRT